MPPPIKYAAWLARGIETSKAANPKARISVMYMPAIWAVPPPVAFMMPIWRVCWVMMAVMVLMIKKELSSTVIQPSTERMKNTPWVML